MSTISSGQSLSGVDIGPGTEYPTLDVTSGGIVTDITLLPSSDQNILTIDGGSASGVTLDHDTEATLDSGTIADLAITGSQSVVNVDGGTLDGVTITGFGGTVYVNAGTLTGAVNVIATSANEGNVYLAVYQEGTISGATINGYADVEGGTVVNTTLGGSGSQSGGEIYDNGGLVSSTRIASGQSLYIQAGDAYQDIIESGGSISLGSSRAVSELDLQPGAIMALRDLAWTTSGRVTLASQGTQHGILVTEGSGSDFIPLAGHYQAGDFALAQNPNGSGDTLVLVDDGTPCYCPGTLIATPDGERPIEDLAIGDCVLTRDHGVQPIRWIGGRSYSGRFAARNPDVMPVIICTGALADNVPHSDLWVSPLHALFLDGVLVPAVALVNGVSIVQAEQVEAVTYIHLELAQHGALLANAAEAESFLDDDSRGMFHNHRDYDRLYPDAPRLLPVYCAPRVTEGAALEAIRARLRERAHGLGKSVRRVPLVGYVDVATPDTLAGWVHDPETPDMPVDLEVWESDRLIATVTADRSRPDVRQAGAAPGDRVGFTIALGAEFRADRFGIARHLELRCACTGALFAVSVIALARAVA